MLGSDPEDNINSKTLIFNKTMVKKVKCSYLCKKSILILITPIEIIIHNNNIIDSIGNTICLYYFLSSFFRYLYNK